MFDQLPEGDVQLKDWSPYQIDGPVKALIVSDIHFPYHDKRSLCTAFEHGQSFGADTIILNGDTIDFYKLSKFSNDPRNRDFAEELRMVKEFFAAVRQVFPHAHIVFKTGNHEERYESYMRTKAPELLGVPDFELNKLLSLDTFNIRFVTDKRPIRLGQLNVLHGHEYQFAISNPVNAARGLFLRAKAYCICGHLHQKSEHSENTVEGKSIATWSTGCLCDLHPAYKPINNWSHGFSTVEVYDDGKFLVSNHRVSNGKIY